VSECFGVTLQAEGLHAGWPCVFLRFSGCQLWKDPSKPSPVCTFCDTPQLHNSVDKTQEEVVSWLRELRGSTPDCGLVISGGEPLLQLDAPLLHALVEDFNPSWIDVETNGIIDPSETLRDALRTYSVSMSCSPKTKKIPAWASWYKVLIPHMEHLLPAVRESAELFGKPIYLQATEVGGVDSEESLQNVKRCIELCLQHGYRYSHQFHKTLGLK
jgi:7-carboxy-7-deazaguanine synthase